jgi:uncharacterized membrane protein
VTSPFTPRGGTETDTPDTIVGLSFDDPFRAQEFMTASMRLASQGTIELRDAVTIVKDGTGKTYVRETIDPQPGRSAMSGAAWAGLFGLLLGGPVGWLAGAAIGAGSGVVRAKMIDLGVPDEWVEWFRGAVRRRRGRRRRRGARRGRARRELVTVAVSSRRPPCDDRGDW